MNGLAEKVDPACVRPVNAGNADVSSATVGLYIAEMHPRVRPVIPNIRQRFSRFALSADGTSAFPAIDCLVLTRVAAGSPTLAKPGSALV
jgi:hypothetical protein